jgi:hypothetical protein
MPRTKVPKTKAQLDAEILAYLTKGGRRPAGYIGSYADASGNYNPAFYDAAQRAAGARFDAKRAAKVRRRQARLRKAGKI